MLWMTLALAATGTEDLAWQSPAQPVPIHDEAPIFVGPLVDSGWWPSSTDPLAVRFHITPSGTVFTDIDADSELAWPDPLWHRIVAIPDTGTAMAEAAVDIEAELQINIGGLYTGVVDLWTRNFDMEGATAFDGMLLDGDATHEVDVVAAGNAGTVIEYSFQVILGLDVVALVEVLPEVEVTLSDGELVSDVAGQVVVQDVVELWGAVPIEPGMPSTMDTSVTWSAWMDGVLNVVFVPTIELDTWVGNFELFALPLDVLVVDVEGREDADTALAAHPIPGLETLVGAFDFGEVLLGQERSLPLPVSNLGDMDLEGNVFIDGDGAFTVFPDTLVARSQETDGLSVTFTPSAEVPQGADLVIVSNDPLVPEVRIPLTGLGYLPPEPELPDPTTTETLTDGTTTDSDGGGRVNGEDTKSKGGCGCSGAGGLMPVAPWALMLVGLIRRRR